MAAPTTYDRNSRIEVLLEALINAVEHSGSGTIARYGGRVDTYADLPETAAPNTYYFVGPVDSDSFDEYMWAEVQGGTGHWDRLGSVTIIIDDHLDGASTNPVQNAVITNWLAPTYVQGTTYHKNDIVYHRYGLTDYGFFMAKVENPNSTPGVSSSDWELMSSVTAIVSKSFNAIAAKADATDTPKTFKKADLYDATTGTYAVKDTCVQAGVLYICKTAISTPEAFDSSKWDAVTNAYGRLYMQPITEAAHNALLTIDPNTFYIIL